MRSSLPRILASNLSATTSYSTLRHASITSVPKRSFTSGFRAQVPGESSSAVSGSEPKAEAKVVHKPPPATSEDAKAQEQARDGIPFLAQPLGVAEPPTGKHSRWADIIWDDKLRVKQRGALLKEVVKGNFDDLNATRHHGGKMWIAPPALIRENKARYFPDIEGTSLATSEKTYTTDILLKKVSLVSILSSKISEIQTHMFTEPTCTQYSGDRHFQHLKINLQENKMRSVLVSFFASSIRKTMPKEQWPFYMISSQNMDYIRDDIGLRNKFIGYVFLVDDKCRIRWAGCADPQPAEIQALRTCTGNLLKRLK